MLYTSHRRRIAFVLAALLMAVLPAAAQAAGGGSTLTVTAGTLTITGAAPGNFTATLTGADQQVYTTLGAYSASDTTGSGNGWHVTFQATQFACTSADAGCPSTGDSLPASSLLMAPPTVACATGTSCNGRAAPPTIKISANTALDSGTAVSVASAASKAGMGGYNFTPGAIGTGSLQLTVPSYAYATTYHSTLTVSIVSGP
jgi:hypothetical protein